jgi:hypothetical protein
MVRLNRRERFFCPLYGKIKHKRKIIRCPVFLPYRVPKNLSSVPCMIRLNTRERFFGTLYGKIKHKRKILLCPVW